MTEDRQGTLDRILGELKSGDPTVQLAAIRDVGRINYSSEAIVRRLERLAIEGTAPVQYAALEALDSEASHYVRSMAQRDLKPDNRLAILAEIEDWAEGGLISPDQAQVLKGRYTHERKAPKPAAPPPKEAAPAAAQAPAAKAPPVPKPAAPPAPKPAAPSMTLSERLLSQTTINISLYLGAFLVIGAAVILAALVEVTRLPILLTGTLLFAAGAVVIKRRLPQPSFIFFLVFSFLLPISANVIADQLKLTGRAPDVYWTVVFLFMAAIWGFGTWFYSSRLFSFAAFASWALTLYRFPTMFSAPQGWQPFALVLASLSGLGAYHLLRPRHDRRLTPLLPFAAQLLTFGALWWVFAIVINLLPRNGGSAGDWTPIAGAAIAAAAFYALSRLVLKFPLFAWAAAACLLPVSWLTLRAFDASSLAHAYGFAVWAIVLAAASEVLRRRPPGLARELRQPLLLACLPLFIAATIGGASEGGATDAFVLSLAAALVYSALMVLKPRAALWFAALLFGLVAYFTFFALPLMESHDVAAGYQILGASLLLLVPGLFLRSGSANAPAWRRPLTVLGLITASVDLIIVLAVALLDEHSLFDDNAVILASLALVGAAYGLRMNRPRLGYVAAALAAAALPFALNEFSVVRRFEWLTVLSVVYFAGGILQNRDSARVWSIVLRISGLVLGAMLAVFAILTPEVVRDLAVALSVLILSAEFYVEIFLRRGSRLESLAPLSACAAVYLLLWHFDRGDVAWHTFAFSLVWLLSDLAYRLRLKSRPLPQATWAVAGILTLVNVPLLLWHAYQRGHADESAIMFGIYVVVFVAAARVYRQPRLAFAATATLAFATLLTLEQQHQDLWMQALTGLAILYYAAGYLLGRRGINAAGSVLRISALVLGAVASAFAVVLLKPHAAWYVGTIAALYLVDLYLSGEDRLEIGAPILFCATAYLAGREWDISETAYLLLAMNLIWLAADLLYQRTLVKRAWAPVTRIAALLLGIMTVSQLLAGRPAPSDRVPALGFAIYAVFLAFYAWMYAKPQLGYLATASLPLSAYFALRFFHQENWLYFVAGIAVVYYAAGYLLRRSGTPGWSRMLLFSGLGVGVFNSIAAAEIGGMDAAIPVAIAATLFAVEAFALRNVWLGFPANVLYLESYFLILFWLEVDQPQFFSIGAALLGMLMHYLLVRAGSRAPALLVGTFSQLVLLGTTFIQLLANKDLMYFTIILLQGLAVLAYGVVVRSRSLVIAPIVFIVASVLAVIYTALKGLGTVVLVGCVGIMLLLLGVVAVIMRERIARLGERLSEWQA